MKNPFSFLFRNRKLNKATDIEPNTTEEQNSVIANKAEVTPTERDILLSKLDTSKLNYILYRTEFDINSISIEFLQKLDNSPALVDYLYYHVLDEEILKKIIEGTLKVSDIKKYNEEIFQYDIFSSEDKEILDILRNRIELSNNGYATFSYDEFISSINANDFLDECIEPLIGEEKIFISKTKATILPQNSIYSIEDNISICYPVNKDNIICKDMFDYYYSGDINFNQETILFISYENFIEWAIDEEKSNILKTVQVAITDNFDIYKIKFQIRNFTNHFKFLGDYTNFFEVDNGDKLIIQVNHLLYLLEKSELDISTKLYYDYSIKTNFLDFVNDKTGYYKYNYEKNINRIANEIKERLNNDFISKHTAEFNKLDIEDKRKQINKPIFTAQIFLGQFENFDDITAFELLEDYIARLNKEDRKLVLKEQAIIDKLKGLLKESSYDEYRGYERFCKVLDADDIFKIFDANFIKHFYKNNRNYTRYRFFYSVLNYNDVNKGIDYLINDEDFFKEFINDISYLDGPLSKLNYDTTLKLLKKLENDNYGNNISFISSIDIKEQFNLLKEDFSNNFLVKIVTNSSKKVQQFFYLEDKRFTYLWENFDILRLSQAGYIFNDDVVSKKEFLDKFKGKSMITFRANVNRFLINQPDIYFEEKITKYEDELISNFDINTGLFNQYKYLIDNINFLDDRKFSMNGIDFFYDVDTNYECRKYIGRDDEDKVYIKDKDGLVNYLTWLSKLKLNEVIIDRLFKDNIYNVFLNIKEMLRFNKGLNDDDKVLDLEQEEFYNTILNIDKLDKEKIIEIYNKFKDKNVALMFYEDLRKLKDKSYDKIKRDMFKPEDMKVDEDKELSSKYGVHVYDLRDKEYVILCRCLNSSYHEQSHHKRDCYTLLTNDNSKVMHDDALIYGYSGFDNDCILHVNEADSFSGDIKNDELGAGSNVVNRIMTSKEIATNSSWFSEIQIVNKKSDTKTDVFETLRPSFLIVYDEIDPETLREARRMNIPICIISKVLNKDMIGDYNPHDALHDEDFKYTAEWGVVKENERRKGR